jgi:hypothetical protein
MLAPMARDDTARIRLGTARIRHARHRTRRARHRIAPPAAHAGTEPDA